MKHLAIPFFLIFPIALFIACAGGGGSTAPLSVVTTPNGEVSFQKTIAPILKDHCIRCHGEDRKGDLYILSYEGIIKGGKSGSFVVPGDPDSSRLITSVEKTKVPFMPPKIFPALTEDRITAIRTWINEGANNN